MDNIVVDDDEYAVYDDVAFMAHRGNLSDETGEEGVEIWVYVWNEEEEAWYDHAHLVTDDNGEAWLYNETCGQYQWESSVDDGGHYEVWIGCDDGGGGTENYDEWIYSWIHYVPQDENGNNNWNEIVVGYDPDTDCDCDVEIYVVLEVYDENGNLAADSSSSHTINGDQQDWFLQEISMNIEPGNYDFILNMYDEHGNHEEEKSFSLIMSDEWLDYDWGVEEDSNVKIGLQGNTNYDGEIHTYYEANVYRWNENDNDWEKIDELAENATISSGDENSAYINFEWEAEESGDYRFVVYMYDGMGQEDSFEFETNLVLNSAPEIGDLNKDWVFEGQMVDFKVDAWDEDGDDLKFTWDMGDGEKREGESVRYGYPDDGTYTIEVSVSDGEATSVKEFEVKVENLDPELTVSFTDEADEGSELSFAAQVDDVSMDDVTVTWTFADGSKLDGIFVQYDFNDDGEYLITVVAEDDDGGRTEEQILVTIKNVDPIFTEFVMPSSAEEGEALNFMVTATDPGDDTITYTFDFGDGTAVMMSPDGNISHKFAEGDTFDVIICAKDEDGGETCRTETIPVSVLEQLEEEGLLPGFGLLGALSALAVIGILRRRTH
ncbi:MAG: PKD domain-containing protein [Candidatus Thermoplasmatota archaeon]|nr:PKD domain-containing protein [Candidatus Thermoplasmatota archaeon]